MKIPTLPQLSAVMISILSGDSSEILVLRAASVHLENISQIIEKQRVEIFTPSIVYPLLYSSQILTLTSKNEGTPKASFQRGRRRN